MKLNTHFMWMMVLAVFLSIGPNVSLAKKSDQIPTNEVILSEEDSDELTKALPKAIQQLFFDEIDLNGFFMDEENQKEFERLEEFSPISKRWYYLPHLEIPLSHIEALNESAYLDSDYRKLFFFTRGGKKYIRYFLHPFREMKNYEELIKKYPLKYKYVARPTSSPRSLIVINPDRPDKPEWVKVSLHVKLTDLQRRQKLEKLARALAVNEALEQIEDKTLRQLNFSWLPEPLAVKLPQKEEVIIGRDLDPYMKAAKGRKRLRSTFAFFAAEDGEVPELKGMIKKSGMNEFKFLEKYFIEPAVRVFAYLGFVEGIQWGMHTANYMTEVNSQGLPNGHIVLKDFDGAWFDVEMRMLQQRPFEGIHGMMNEPFAEFLFPSATGRNSGKRQHFGEIYNRYIRNASGFSSLGSLIYQYLLKHGNTRMAADPLKRKVQDMIDKVMIEEVKKYTDLDFTLDDMKSGHLKKNGLNKALNHLRQEMLNKIEKPEQATEKLQVVLKNEFLRLAENKRVWVSFSNNEATIKKRFENTNTVLFFDAERGMIQIRSYRGANSDNYSIAGYALLEDKASAKTKAFMKKVNQAKPKKKRSCEEQFLVWWKLQQQLHLQVV